MKILLALAVLGAVGVSRLSSSEPDVMPPSAVAVEASNALTESDWLLLEKLFAPDAEYVLQVESAAQAAKLAPPEIVDCGSSVNGFTNGTVGTSAGHATEQGAAIAAALDCHAKLGAIAQCVYCPRPGCDKYVHGNSQNLVIVTVCDPITGLWSATATYTGPYAVGCWVCPAPPV